MQAPSAREFQKAIIKKFNAHIEKKLLVTNHKRTGAKIRTSPPIHTGVPTQEVNQYQTSVQTQGMPQCSQLETIILLELLQDVLACRDLFHH